MHGPRLDETNLQLLVLLQRSGRMSTVELARAVGRSESVVRERVASMELDGLLKGYEARVDWTRLGLPRQAIVRARAAKPLAEVGARLAAIPHVTEVLHVTGNKPLVVHLRVRDVAHLAQVIAQRLEPAGLTDLDSEVAMESLLPLRPPALLSDLLTETRIEALGPRVP